MFPLSSSGIHPEISSNDHLICLILVKRWHHPLGHKFQVPSCVMHPAFNRIQEISVEWPNEGARISAELTGILHRGSLPLILWHWSQTYVIPITPPHILYDHGQVTWRFWASLNIPVKWRWLSVLTSAGNFIRIAHDAGALGSMGRRFRNCRCLWGCRVGVFHIYSRY